MDQNILLGNQADFPVSACTCAAMSFVTLNEAEYECSLFQIQNGFLCFPRESLCAIAYHFALDGTFITDTNLLAVQLEPICTSFPEMCNLIDSEYDDAKAALTP
jgi:hypothetical protein